MEATSAIPDGFSALLTAQQVAAVLNVSVPYVYKLWQAGEMPTVRMGKAVRVTPADLKQYIEGSRA